MSGNIRTVFQDRFFIFFQSDLKKCARLLHIILLEIQNSEGKMKNCSDEKRIYFHSSLERDSSYANTLLSVYISFSFKFTFHKASDVVHDTFPYIPEIWTSKNIPKLSCFLFFYCLCRPHPTKKTHGYGSTKVTCSSSKVT